MKDFSSFQCRILNKSPELMANGLFSFLSRQKWKVKESNCINHYQKKKKKKFGIEDGTGEGLWSEYAL